MKYKDYNRLQDLISGKVPPPKPESQSRPKRKADADEPSLPRPAKRAPAPTRETPKKRRATAKNTIPSHDRIFQPSITNPFSSPSTSSNLFTPQKPVAIGPTPQKDGKLLGLFDLLPDESPEKPGGAGGAAVNATPSKRGAHMEVGDILATPTGAKHSRTPRSSSKRFLLDAFMTPLKRRLSNAGNSAKKSLTPSSVSKLNFSTPLFLRRDNPGRPKLEAVREEDEDAVISPEAPTPRGPRRPLVRGLSSMLASLREMQDSALDEDEEAMREMEGGGEPASRPRPLSATKLKLPIPPPEMSPLLQPDALPDVLVQDGQRPNNPFMEFPDLDFNKDIEYDDEEDEMDEQEKRMIERDSKLPVYKKKGQKRTTRRHNMKPVAPKKPPTREHKAAEDDDIPHDDEVHDLLAPGAEILEADVGIIPDTQHATFSADSLPLFESKRNFDSESEDGTEYTASIGGTRYKRAKRPSDYKTDKEARKHKVGTQVHTNYQRLKMRGNTGMKGKSTYGRRR